MSNVEEHVVSMKFNNKDFERNAQKSLGTIERLKQALKFDKSADGLKKLGDEVDKLDLRKISTQMDTLEKRFSTFGLVGAAAINRITNAAMDLGKTMVKDVAKPFTSAFSQIKSGGLSRAMNLEHANFQLEGLLKNAKEAEKIISGPVSRAVDGTAYGLDQAAVAASSLVATGIKGEDAIEGVLKSIAGVASMTGRDFSDISQIFTTVAGQGKLMTMQLRQLESSGINAAGIMAKQMGKTEAEIREMVTHSEISFQQFSNAMQEAFGEQAAKANETFSGALSNVKAALSRIGAKVATPGLDRMRDTFNSLRLVINAFNNEIDKGMYYINALVRNFTGLAQALMKDEKGLRIATVAGSAFNLVAEKMYKFFAIGGPFYNGLKAIGNIFKAIGSVIKPVAEAFLDIFPVPAIKRVQEIANSFREFTAKLKLSGEVANNLRRTFRGVFAVIHAVSGIIKMVISTVFDFVKALAPAGTALTNLFGTIGDILTRVAYYITVAKVAIEYTLEYFHIAENLGMVISKVFSAVFNVISSTIKLIGSAIALVVNSVLSIFGVVTPPIKGFGDVVILVLQGIGIAINFVLGLIDELANIISNVADVLMGGANAAIEFEEGLDTTSGIMKIIIIVANAVKTAFFGIVSAIASVIEYISDSGGFVNAVFGVLSKLGEGIATLYRVIKNFLTENFGSAFNAIKQGFIAIGNAIAWFTEKVSISQVVAAAFIGTMIAMAIAIVRVILSLTKVTSGIAHMTNSIGGFFDALKAKFKPSPMEKLTNILRELTIMIVAVTTSLVILANTPNVWDAVKVLGAVAAGVAVLTIVVMGLAKLAQKVKMTRQIAAVATAMLAISGSVLVLTLALKMLETVNTDGIIQKAAAIAIMTASLGLTAALMSKIAPNLSKGTIGLFFFALSVKKVVEALQIIADKETLSEIQESIPVLIAIMGGLSVLAVALGSVRLSSGLGFMLVALAIRELLPVIKECINEAKNVSFEPLKEFSWEFLATVGILGGVLALVAVTIKKISEGFRNFALGILLIAGAVSLLTHAIEVLGNIGADVLKRGGAAVGQILIIFGLLMVASMATKNAKPMQMAASFLMMSGAIAALIACIFVLGTMDPQTLKQGGLIVGGILGIFAILTLVSAATKNAKPKEMAAMFASVAGAVAVLVACIYVLGTMSYEQVLQGGVVVGGILIIFGIITAISAATKNAKPKEMAAMFLAMAGALAVLTGCIKIIGEMPLEDVLKGGITVAALLILMEVLVKKLSKLPTIKNVKKIIVPVISVLLMLASVIAALMIVATMPVEDIVKSGVTIVALMLVMEGLVKKLNKLPSITNYKKVLVPVLSVIGMLATITVAMLLLSNLSIGEAITGILSIVAGMAIMVGVLKLVSGIKFDASAWKGMLAACAMMLSVGLALQMIAGYNWVSLLASAAAMGTCLLAVAYILKNFVSELNIEWNQMGKFLLGCGSLVIIAIAIKQVAEYNWLSLLAAAGGISLCLAAFVSVFEMFNRIKIEWSQLGKFALGLASLYLVALSMSKVLDASQNWKAIIAAASGLSLCIGAVAVVFAMFTMIDVKLSAVLGFAAAVGGLYIVAAVLEKIVSAGDYLAIEAAGNALLKAVVAIGLVLVELAAAAALGVAVLAGLPILTAAIAGLSAVVIAMGAIYEIPFVQELIESGGKLLAALGKAIGGFFGGIVNGFATVAADALPSIGKSLADFSTESAPFWNMLRSFEGTGILQAAKDITGVVMVLTAASFLNQISDFFSWLTGGDGGFEDLAKDLCTFGKGMADFQVITKDVKAGQLRAVGEAAKVLGEVLEILSDQKSGGIFDIFTGTTDWAGTLDGLSGFGEVMANLSDEMVQVKPENLAVLKDCAEATKNLVDSMPEKHGAIKGLFSSYKDLGGTSDDMKSWAQAMVDISNTFTNSKINSEAIASATNAAKLIAALANELPDKNGFISGLFSSEKEGLDEFAEDMGSFAEGITKFSETVNGKVDEKAVTAAANAGKLLAELAAALPETDDGGILWGLVSWGDDRDDLEDFGDTLVPFAESLVEFSNSLGGLDYEALTKFEPTIDALSSIMENVVKLEGGDFESFGATFEHFGEALKTFSQNTDEIDSNKVEQFSGVLGDLITVFNKKFGTNIDKFKGLNQFTKSINSINDSLKMITSDRREEMEQFGTTLEEFAENFTKFMTGENGVSKVDTAQVKEFAKQLDILQTAMSTSGKGQKKNQMDFKEFGKFAADLKKAVNSIVKLSSGKANIDQAKNSLVDITSSLKTFILNVNSIGNKDIEDAKDNLNDITKMINNFSGKKLNVSGLKSASTIINSAFDKMLKAMNSIKQKLDTTYLEKIRNYASSVVSEFSKALYDSNAVSVIAAGCGNFINKVVGYLDIEKDASKYKSAVNHSAENLVNGFRKGLLVDQNAGGFWQTGVDAAKKFMEGFKSKKGIDEHSPSKKMEQSGDYAVQGFINGIDKDMSKLVKSGESMGTEFLDSIDSTLGIHSPATELIARAKNVVAGWLNGLKSGASKIFDSGSSFGGDFLSGLKDRIASITSGDFSGDKLLDNLKKKLGFDKILDAKKEKDKASKNLGKVLENLGKDSSVKDAAKGAGGSIGKTAGNEAAREFKAAFAAALLSLKDIIGSEVTVKDLGKALGYDKMNKEQRESVAKLLNTYKSVSEAIIKDSNKMHAAMSNTAAIKKFAKSYESTLKYISKTAKQVNNVLYDSANKVSTKSLLRVGKYLGAQTKEYKEASKNIIKYTNKISANENKALKKTKQLTDLYSKYQKETDEKRKSRLKKQIESIEKYVTELENKQRELRKKSAQEYDKIAKAAKNALKKMRKEIRETVKSWLDFKNLDLENPLIASGIKEVSEETTEATQDLSRAQSLLTESTNETKESYDALNASMDTGISLFDRFTKSGTVESAALFENADSQLEAYEEFQNGIEELEKRGLDISIVDQLASEGPQALNKIRGFLSMNTDEIAKYNERVEKQYEYEAKALERNLRRQYEQWQKYLTELAALKERFGAGFENNPAYLAIEASGFGNANYISRLLKMDSSSFTNATNLIKDSLSKVVSSGAESASKDIEDSGKTIYSSVVQGMIDADEKNKAFDKMYKDAIDIYGVNSSLAKYIYDMGSETGAKYFEGLKNSEDVKKANELWEANIASGVNSISDDINSSLNDLGESTSKSASLTLKQLFESIATQVSDQNRAMFLDKNDSFTSLFSNFLSRYASMLNTTVDKLDKSELNSAFNTLISDLKDYGLSSTEIYDKLKEWIGSDETAFTDFSAVITGVAQRTKNNTELTAQSVKESWQKTIDTMTKSTGAMASIVNKLGGHMTTEMYEYLKELSPEELVAMNSLSDTELQDMADQFYNANKAADYLADNIYASAVDALDKSRKSFAGLLAANDDTLSETEKNTKKFAKWLYNEMLNGKSYEEIVKSFFDTPSKVMREKLGISSKDDFKEIKNYMTNLNTLITSGYSTDTIVEKLGSVSNPYMIWSTALGNGEEIRGYIDQTFGGSLTDGAIKLIKDIADSSSSVGSKVSDIPETENEVIFSKLGKASAKQIAKSSDNMSDSIKTVSEEALEKSKPKYTECGKKLGKTIVKGMDKFFENSKKGDELIASVMTKLKKIAEFITDEDTGAMKIFKKQGKLLGTEVINGIVKGIKNGSDEVAESLKEMAKNAIEAAKGADAFDINSPSKAFEYIGTQIIAGLTKGVDDNANLVDQSLLNISDSTLSSMKQAIASVNDVIDNELQTSPVITPTLNLRSLNAQANSINRLFDSTVNVSGKTTNNQNEQSENGNTTFIQNNYSPKALSREEIYRQTNNLFARTRKAVAT